MQKMKADNLVENLFVATLDYFLKVKKAHLKSGGLFIYLFVDDIF